MNSRIFPVCQDYYCSTFISPCHLLTCEPQPSVISDNLQKTFFYVQLCQFISLATVPSKLSEFLVNWVYSLGKVRVIVAEKPGYFMEKFLPLGAIGFEWAICLLLSRSPKKWVDLRRKFHSNLPLANLRQSKLIKSRAREALTHALKS